MFKYIFIATILFKIFITPGIDLVFNNFKVNAEEIKCSANTCVWRCLQPGPGQVFYRSLCRFYVNLILENINEIKHIDPGIKEIPIHHNGVRTILVQKTQNFYVRVLDQNNSLSKTVIFSESDAEIIWNVANIEF